MTTPKKKSQLRSAPGRTERDAALEAFVAGAGEEPKPKVEKKLYTWEEPQVREDMMKQVLLKMPEPLYLKLKHITNYTPYNMTSFILEKITPEIEKEIAELMKMGR